MLHRDGVSRYKVVCREGREWWELNGFELYHYIGGESLHCVLDLTGNWNAYRFRYDGGKFIGHLRIAYRRYVKLQRLAADVRAALEGIADSLEAREKAVRACIEACGPTPSRAERPMASYECVLQCLQSKKVSS